jgi:hypothetical protein
VKIELKEITIAALTNGYQDNDENGVVGYGGKLDIRPPYQREFVYGDKERKAVIDTLQKETLKLLTDSNALFQFVSL